MKKYKCSNPQCGYEWQSESEPFECPICKGSAIETLKESKTKGKISRYLWLILSLIAITIAIGIFLLTDKKTTVSTSADYVQNTITVEIKGAHQNDYRVQLMKDGVVYDVKENDSDITFKIAAEGTYSIMLIYIGEGDAPETPKFQDTFTFEETPIDMPDDEGPDDAINPQIIKIDQTPKTPSDQYAIKIKINLKGDKTKLAEYSMDDGSWQKSNIFKNVEPGKHVFAVRNKKNESLSNTKSLTLEQPIAISPKGEVIIPGEKTSVKLDKSLIDNLLSKIFKGNEDAGDELLKLLGQNTPVTGVSHIQNVFDLQLDAYTNRYTVVDLEKDNSGRVISLKVKRI